MTGIDTNVLVRYLVQDHPGESKKAADFIEKNCIRENPGFINQIVLCETVWVLESAYHYKKALISEVLEKVLMTAQFSIENKSSVWVALHGYRDSKADFADCLIGLKNREEGCGKTMTFDQSLKNLNTFQLL